MFKKNCEKIQEENSDCGITCLYSIIKYYGGYIPLETLRYETNTNEFGTNAYELIEYAKKIGFNSYAKRIELNKLEKKDLPLIIHLKLENNFYHFVVVYKITRDYFLLMNPSVGFKKITYKELNKLYTGVSIFFKPISNLPTLNKNDFIYKNIKSHLKFNLPKLLIIIGLSLFTLLSLILESFEIKILSYNKNYIYILFILISINQLFVYIKNKLILENSIIFNDKMINYFIKYIFILPLNYLKLKEKGEITTRFNELDNLTNNIMNIVIEIIFNTLLLLILIIIILNLNRYLFCLIMLFSTIYFIINKKIYKKLVNIIKCSINVEETYNSNILDIISNFSTIKHINIYDYFMNNINNNLKNKHNINKSINKKVILINIFNDLFINYLFLAIMYILLNNKTNYINGILLLTMINYYINILKKNIEFIPTIILYKNIILKNNDFLAVKSTQKKYCECNKYYLEIQNLNYSITNNIIINNLNYNIYENDKIFINGPSGVGKSTFLKILNNEIINYKGKVLLDDKSLLEYDLTNIVSYTSQDESIFNDTIYNNLMLGKSIDEDKLNNVINICRLNDINIIKECGLNIMLINGNLLSGGEKNRIILARSLLHSKKIIILDEVLKEVDYELEKLIIKDILKYYKDNIILYVSHKNVGSLFPKTLTFRKE